MKSADELQVSEMSLDMFMKIDNLVGESTDKVHTGEIDVLGWTWGISNAGSAHQGGGAGSSKANVRDVSFTKYADRASPLLVLAACSGQHFDQAVLVVRKAGEKPLDYLKITLSEVFITAVALGGAGSQDKLTESVSLNFASVKMEYVEQTKGGGKGATPSINWNIATNSKY